MKACLLRHTAHIETNPLEWAEFSPSDPGEGQILVRVGACGVCRTDLHVIEGELKPRKSPLIPGHQIVGVVEKAGERAGNLKPGTRVGVAWLHSACGKCDACRKGKENLCDNAEFTGYTVDGGYAEAILARSEFVYPLPPNFPDEQAAPLLCAGIIGFRSLRLSGIQPGARLGIYGFGAAGHVAIQVARHWGVEVYVCSRDDRHRELASELGATWTGAAAAEPPVKLDAAILFAPAGELVPTALRALEKGATLVLGGIHMTPIPQMPYELLYHERVVRSVANNTRQDGHDFLRIAAEIPIRTRVELFPLQDANRALNALKNDAIRGAAVLQVK